MSDVTPPEKAPWGRWTLFLMAILFSFIVSGILAGINWGRIGRPDLKWKTIASSFFLLIPLALLSSAFSENNIPLMQTVFLAISGIIAIVLWATQEKECRLWKESHPEARRAGWQIPMLTAIILSVLIVSIFWVSSP